MHTSTPTIRFENGDEIPQLGLGTWESPPGEVGKAVKTALELGYRHIDCAAVYGNEKEIGDALAEVFSEGKIRRDEVWITSKLWNNAHAPEDVQGALRATLANLQLDFLDLYLIHWPVAAVKQELVSLEKIPILTTWTAMEKLVDEGLCRHIGVSNFSVKKMRNLVENATRRPEMNQVELHPYLQQQALLDYCDAHGVVVTGYSPLGSPGRPAGLIADDEPRLLDDAVVVKLAADRNVSVAQILLQWAMKRGTVVIPKSVTTSRIEENLAASKVELTDDDVALLDALDLHRRYVDGAFWVKEGSPYTLASLWDED